MPRAVAEFLRGLEEGDEGAAPGVLVVGEDLRGAEQAGDVDVVSTRVHDRHVLAVLTGGGDRRGVRQASGLPHRQRVHVSTQEDAGPVTVRQDADDARAADLAGDVEATGLEPIGRGAGRLRLLVRQFGVRVQVLVELLETRAKFVEGRGDPFGERSRGGHRVSFSS